MTLSTPSLLPTLLLASHPVIFAAICRRQPVSACSKRRDLINCVVVSRAPSVSEIPSRVSASLEIHEDVILPHNHNSRKPRESVASFLPVACGCNCIFFFFLPVACG